MKNKFVNGFTSWMEAHHEVVSSIAIELNKNTIDSPVIAERCEKQGIGGIYELAEELTDEFEKLNEKREWDGEFFDEIEEFLTKKLF